MCFKFRLFNQSYIFQLSNLFLTFWVFMLLLMVTLGFWQIKRYHFKLRLLNDYSINLSAASVPLANLDTHKNLLTLQFKPVTFSGFYQNDQNIFIPNRQENNRDGFEVITPVTSAANNKQLVLVDRGWVKKTSNPPQVASVKGLQAISGRIKLLNEYQFILGPTVLSRTGNSFIMQKIVIDELQKLTRQTYYPFLLRLNKNDRNGFSRNWVVTTVEPSRHLGYAVQWFVMSLVLGIAISSVGLRKI